MTIDDIANNGIIGAGGAGFPTHIKLSSRPEYLIMNAAECEPLIHKDKEILIHFTSEVLQGFHEAMKLTGASKGIIGIKEKHHEVVEKISKNISNEISIEPIGDFYPAGDEVTLIHLTTGRIMQPGTLPISVGCIVQNVETLYNIAVNKPVVEKVLTVTGEVDPPMTIKAPIGSSYEEILAHFRLITSNYVVCESGLMMGSIKKDLKSVITKTTAGLIVLPADHPCVNMVERYSEEHTTVRLAKAACDQCNFCTELCPRYLMGYPVRPETAMRNTMFRIDELSSIHLGNSFCCECNLCTLFACPESLDPRGATIMEKQVIHQNNIKWEGLPITVHPMMDYRKVPTEKLMQRLDVTRYKDEAPFNEIAIVPKRVSIPLDQHVGAPASPVVEKGQRVRKYDLIAKASGKISSNIHGSIDGTVETVNENEIIIQGSS